MAVLERPDRRSAKPDEQPVEVSDIVKATHARGHRVFAGRLDRHRLGFGEKAVVVALRADGDFRDWDAIDTWGAQIAAELSPGHRPLSRRSEHAGSPPDGRDDRDPVIRGGPGVDRITHTADDRQVGSTRERSSRERR
jgi:hypothetical protein